jgi:uncharacterized membrane protein
MRRGLAGLVGLLTVALLAACGDGGAGSCPNDQPDSCPSPAPSFSAQVGAIVHERCAVCHAPGGQEANRPFQTHAQIFSQRVAILAQVASCRMPPPGAAAPTAEERQALLAWLVCGAPNN